MKGRIIFILCAILLLSEFVCAKRMPPVEVAPVSNNTYRVANVIRFSFCHDDIHGSGIIEVYDAGTGAFLWWMRIYKVHHNDGLEEDIQNVYISEMTIDDDLLIITNERGMVFSVNLSTKEALMLKDVDVKRNKITLDGTWSVEKCPKKQKPGMLH